MAPQVHRGNVGHPEFRERKLQMSDYAIGVDLGGTNLRVAAIDAEGNILARMVLETEVSRGRDAVVNELCRAVHEISHQLSPSLSNRIAQGDAALAGIGVGVPGLIDSESGMLLESPNLPGWCNYDVQGEIERRLQTSVILENDANVAALGELWLGAGRGMESLCMYTLGTGVGGGLILQGRIWRGWNGMAGELGHANVEPQGHPCGCGSWGCLEQYASAKAVARMAGEALAAGADTGLREVANGALDSLAVYRCAMRGDAVAAKVFDRVGRALGKALATMINGLNLPLYVIGGGVSAGWDAFAPAMFDEVRKRSFVYAGTTGPNGEALAGRQRSTQIVRRQAAVDGQGVGGSQPRGLQSRTSVVRSRAVPACRKYRPYAFPAGAGRRCRAG
jgi:glucokinase